jgi:putative transcriptional regulator
MRRLLLLAVLAASAAGAQPQTEIPNAVLLVAKPGLADPNFSQTVVLATRGADGSTVGVILNRPTARRHETSGAPVSAGGPVMREVIVALFRSPTVPQAGAFHVLKDVYLTMHPRNLEALLSGAAERYRLYAGFSGWAPGQLESELERDGWYVLPASEEILFRKDTADLWEELVRKARGRVAMRQASGILES